MLQLQHTLESELARTGHHRSDGHTGTADLDLDLDLSIDISDSSILSHSHSNSNKDKNKDKAKVNNKTREATTVSHFDAERLLGALYSGVDQLLAQASSAGANQTYQTNQTQIDTEAGLSSVGGGGYGSAGDAQTQRMRSMHTTALQSASSTSLSDRFEGAIQYVGQG